MNGPLLESPSINATVPIDSPLAGLQSGALTVISSIIGWSYVIAWSASFYPQVRSRLKFFHRRRPTHPGLRDRENFVQFGQMINFAFILHRCGLISEERGTAGFK
jgi:hypothetical protein